MHWNHRVVDCSTEDEEWLEICEVYYDQLGHPAARTAAIGVSGMNVGELKTTLERMLKALEHPVLKEDDFKGNL